MEIDKEEPAVQEERRLTRQAAESTAEASKKQSKNRNRDSTESDGGTSSKSSSDNEKLREAKRNLVALKEDLVALRDKYERTKKKYNELADSNQEMAKSILELNRQLKVAARNAGKLQVSEQTLKMIKAEVDHVLFSFAKFLENDDHVAKATENVYMLLFDAAQRKSFGDIHKKQWLVTYADYVKRYINIKRASGTQQVSLLSSW